MIKKTRMYPWMMAMALAGATLTALPATALPPDQIPARKDDGKRKSKNGTLKTTLDGVPVVIQYGRPTVRGRKLWGKLVPYGKVWRTGADEATTITFKKAVKVQGKKLDAGTYALFTVPGEKSWTLIFNHQAQQWGAYAHDAQKDALRVETKPQVVKASTEALTFEAKGKTVRILWGKLAVPFEVTAG